MAKTKKKKLVERVAAELSAYMKEGKINPDIIERNLSYEGIERIQNLETILGIHFSISPGVVQFIDKLPERLRRIKSINETHTDILRGEIKGSIKWGKTVEKQTENQDGTVFVCGKQERNYNIDENLVLMEFLSIIRKIHRELKDVIKEGYEWPMTHAEQGNFIDSLNKLYKKNVHLGRITKVREGAVHPRQISRAIKSRKAIYRRAAQLLMRYRQKVQDSEEMKKILDETLVVPDKSSTLFELYALFSLIDGMEEEIGEFSINKIEKGCNEIASLSHSNGVVEVYHDSTGRFTIRESANRLDFSVEERSEVLEKFKNSRKDTRTVLSDSGWSGYDIIAGIPDIVMIKTYDEEVERALIGEVKYSRTDSKLREGIEELIEYIHFAKDEEGNYLLESETELMGLLIMDGHESDSGINIQEEYFQNQDGKYFFKILTTKDLEERNLDFLRDFLV